MVVPGVDAPSLHLHQPYLAQNKVPLLLVKKDLLLSPTSCRG
jgi:hypothetical protein